MSEMWVLVPVDPTTAMRKEACKAMSPERRPRPDYIPVNEKHCIRYQAMG